MNWLEVCEDKRLQNLPYQIEKMKSRVSNAKNRHLFHSNRHRSTNLYLQVLTRIMAKLRPPAYPDLGQRFDALHPVMFGSKKVCDGIGSALGKCARVISGSTLSNFAVVRLNAKCETQAAR